MTGEISEDEWKKFAILYYSVKVMNYYLASVLGLRLKLLWFLIVILKKYFRFFKYNSP